MGTSKNSIKSRETEQRLKKSFLSLLYSSSLEKITIKEIAYGANINRCTFYLHYNDINELLVEIEDEIIIEIKEIIKAGKPNFDYINTIKLFGDFLVAKKEVIKALLSDNSNSFEKKFKETMRQGYNEKFKELGYTGSYNKKIDLIVAANFGMFKHWIHNHPEIDVEEFTKLLIEQTEEIFFEKFKLTNK